MVISYLQPYTSNLTLRESKTWKPKLKHKITVEACGRWSDSPSNSTNRGNRGPENKRVLDSHKKSALGQNPKVASSFKDTVCSFSFLTLQFTKALIQSMRTAKAYVWCVLVGERGLGTSKMRIQRHPTQARPSEFSPEGSHFPALPLSPFLSRPRPLGLHTHRPAAQQGGEAGGGAEPSRARERLQPPRSKAHAAAPSNEARVARVGVRPKSLRTGSPATKPWFRSPDVSQGPSRQHPALLSYRNNALMRFLRGGPMCPDQRIYIMQGKLVLP